LLTRAAPAEASAALAALGESELHQRLQTLLAGAA
jgi:hypothetical protein